jgi:HK97 family phage prohead protease
MKKYLSISNKSLEEHNVKTHEELWKKAQSEGYEGLTMMVNSEFTKANGDDQEDNKFYAVFSTADEDRHGDIVFQNWILKSFKKNPVYLDSHNYSSIEHILGKVEDLKTEDNRLKGAVVFALKNPKGKLAYDLATDGFLNTSSVGFIPKKFDDKGNILESELLEISAVSIPANAFALYEKRIVESEVHPDADMSKQKEDEQEDEPKEEEKIEEKKVEETITMPEISKKVKMEKAIARMANEKKKLHKALARAVQQLTEENRESQKRKIHQILRKIQGQI